MRGSVDKEDLIEAMKDGANFHTKLIGEREVICFRCKGYEIVTDYNSDHEAYESVVVKMGDSAVLHSVMSDFHRRALSLAVEWLGKELDPQLSFLEES